jgi:hypothetical protein
MLGHLMGSDPRAMVSTFKSELRRDASIFQDWMNKRLIQDRFGDLMRKALQNALYLFAIVRTAITAPIEARLGYGKQAGTPGQTLIDNEDFCCDTHARCFEDCEYLAHRYEVLYDDVKKSRLFKTKQKLKVVQADDKLYNPGGEEKIRTLTSSSARNDRYRAKVELWEVWLRDENLIVTFDANGDMEEPLLIQPWVGPACGPYQFLSFIDVVGNLVPKGPIMDLVSLHRSTNILWMKSDNQAKNSKRVVAYQDAQAAKTVDDAEDGQWVQMQMPDQVKEVQVGTIDQNVALRTQETMAVFSEQAGNMRALGGLATQADTLGQEKIVVDNASSLVRYMSIRFTQFVQECMKARGWFYWYNPREEMSREVNPPGFPEYKVRQTLDPSDRIGKSLEDLDLQIDPHSTMHQTPQNKVMLIDNWMEKWVIPLLPLWNQPGISDLLAKATEMKAKWTNTPEMLELMEKLHQVQGPPVPDESQPAEPGMPQETTRNYVRTSQPGTTDEGQRQIMQQLMAGGQTNQGQGMEAMLPRAG